MHNTTGGSQYSVSQEMTHLGETSVRTQVLGISASQHLPHHQLQQKPGDPAGQAQAASPISSRPPNFEELVPVTGNFPDEDALASEEGERGPAGTRWPRQETLALLKIRSDMDGVFRDATLKGPLWEDVSRKLAELGYIRSGKKCKEKFENVQKYYKRTKEGRAGRQDGKSYRFFSQLEALHNCSTTSNLDSTNQFPQILPAPLSSAPPLSQTQMPRSAPDITAAPAGGSGPPCAAGGILFSSNSSSSEDDSEEEIEKAVGQGLEIRKRKRSESGGGSRKTMALFEGLMREVIEKQEAMQQKFLETMEKREQERMIREEAWKRQEMARLSREQELMAQERAMAASRDTAVIAFLQKISGQMMQIPSAVATQATTPAPLPQSLAPPEPPPQTPAQPAPSVVPQLHRDQQQPQQEQPQPLNKGPQHSHLQQQPEGQPPPQNTEILSTEIVPFQEQQPHHQPQEIVTTGNSFEAVSSRWPKAEVLALIKLRSGLEPRYQEAGPKGLLWEEISAGMGRMGYSRSAKRCKEKWENINKYFKKVKESNKKRPEDAKTCPYFPELDALYRRKILGGGGSEEGSRGEVAIRAKQDEESELNPEEKSNAVAAMSQSETETKNNNIKHGEGETGLSSLQMQASNGSLPPNFLEDKAVKKPADIMKELMGHHPNHRQQQSVMDYYHKREEPDNTDDLDQEEDDNEEEEEDDNEEEDEEEEHLAYKIQCKRQTRDSSNPGGDEKEAMAPPGSFLAMV